MNFQDPNRPAPSVFALALLFFACMACAMGGGADLQNAVGFIFIGCGVWATWKIGRWAWSQYGSREPFDSFR